MFPYLIIDFILILSKIETVIKKQEDDDDDDDDAEEGWAEKGYSVN